MLDQIKALSIPSRCAADDIVDFNVVILLADTSTIHRIGEFDKDGVLFHDPLNMLAADADDAFMVLIGHMEGYRSGHLLLHKIKTILGSFILRAADVDVEVVFVEAIEDDLYIACVELAIGPRIIQIRYSYSVP